MLSDSIFDGINLLNKDISTYENDPDGTYGYDPKIFELIRNYLVPIKHIGGLLDAGCPDEEIIKIIKRDYPIPDEKLDMD